MQPAARPLSNSLRNLSTHLRYLQSSRTGTWLTTQYSRLCSKRQEVAEGRLSGIVTNMSEDEVMMMLMLVNAVMATLMMGTKGMIGMGMLMGVMLLPMMCRQHVSGTPKEAGGSFSSKRSRRALFPFDMWSRSLFQAWTKRRRAESASDAPEADSD